MKTVSKPTPSQIGLFGTKVLEKRLEEIGIQQTPLMHLAAIVEVFSLFDAGRAAFYRRLHQEILREKRRTLQADELKVLHALNSGCQTRQEIADAARLSPSTVNSHLNRLYRQKLVVRRKKPTEPGKGGDQKTYLWWPVE